MSTSSPVPAGLGRIGPWRVVRRLGRGGVASVYEVMEPERGRRAALKLYRDRGSRRSLEREYRALAGLEHPGIVRVLGCGVHDGGHYLLMELVVGRAAQACARHAGLPGSEQRTALVARVVHDLLEAVAYLHRRGIVHRDIKSSNVLADPAGHVKLLDLGTAGTQRERRCGGRWVPGLERFAGTVAYASPEQLRGDALDGRSDLYAVGVLWYRMLTGELPFPSGSHEQALEARERAAPPPPSAHVAGLDPALSELVSELLAFEPGRRPASAEQVLQRLRPLMSAGGTGVGTLWPPPPPLLGREGPIEALERHVSGQGQASLLLLQGAPGLGVPATTRWVGRQARRTGCWVLQVSALGDGPGNLLSRLLLAVPRHVRRGHRRAPGGGGRVDRALRLLSRLDRAVDRPLLLLLVALERSEPEELAELMELLQLVQQRGLSVRAVAGWEHPDPGLPGPFQRMWPDLPRVLLEPVDPRAAAGLARSTAGGRRLPPAVQADLIRDAGGVPDALHEALTAVVESGRLRPGRTPEGAACWLETMVGLEDPATSARPALGALLQRPADGAPWTSVTSPADAAEGVGLDDLLACSPEEHPDPRVRAVLYAWRGHARTRRGDRDLQADADLFQADEDLRRTEQDGWRGAPGWREYVGLVRAGHLATRGRQMEARRRLDDTSPEPGDPWLRCSQRATELRLRQAEGVPGAPAWLDEARPEWPFEAGACGQSLSGAQASWLLHRGRLGALLSPGWEALTARDAWDAEPVAQAVAARAGALGLVGELSRAVTLCEGTLAEVERWGLGPAQAWLLLALAELELALFRPGLAREHLADCFVLLRHSERPELHAARERIRGRVVLACGEPARAEGALRTGISMLRGTGFHTQSALLECELARALARQGRRSEALDLLEPAEDRLTRAGAMPALAVACSARWEARGCEEPERAWAPVGDWLAAEGALLLELELVLARRRHAVKRRAGLEGHQRRAATSLRALLERQRPEDRAVLALDPRFDGIG
jgi:tRNA A-37 threonylcarbamoyl transferase component Bud32/tetratricopeptide (TPR) repeat protein